MNDFLWFMGLHQPGIAEIFRFAIYLVVGAFFAYSFGSFRWWWIKRTRLPEMWKQARANYEEKIASLTAEVESLTEKLHRAETAAHGRVVMTFDRAVNKE